MKQYKIYTAGKMGGLSFEKQIEWRLSLERAVHNLMQYKEANVQVCFVHPPLFYRYGENLHKSEREAMQWDINQIRDSAIVVVNLDQIESSVGTCMEMGYIEALNSMSTHHIYVIGIGNSKNHHPWITEIQFRQEPNIDDAARYIVDYLLL